MIRHDFHVLQTRLRPVARGSMFYFGFFGAMGMFLPFLTVYFREDLGFSGRQIGVLALVQPLMVLLVAIPTASLADHRRWRVRLLQTGLLGFGLMLMLAVFPRAFLFWVGCRAMMALFASPALPLADSMVARMALTHNLNYGSMRLWGSLSFAVMSAGCGMVWEEIGLRMMLPTTGLVFLLVIASAGLLDEGPPREADTPRVSMWHILRQDIGLLVLTMTAFLIGASIYMSVTFDGIFMTHLGGAQSMIGFMFGLTAFSEPPTMHYSQALIRRFGGPVVLLAACLLLLAAFVGYSLAWQPWMLLATAAMKGFGFGLFWAGTVRLTSERAPKHLTSTVQSIVTTAAFGVAPVMFALIAGEMFDAFGPRSIYFATSACCGMAAVILVAALARGIFRHDA